MTCLEEGKQYILTAQIKIEDEIFGTYACDKYATWLDPDFCPLFTIWVDEGGGHVARFNIGNDYYHHRVWQEEDYNPYYAIFTVDSRLASSNNTYLYLRGPRRNATMLFTDVVLEEYVGTDTRYNFWTSLSPIDSSEIAYDLPDWGDSQNNYPTVPPHPFYYIYWGWHGYGWHHGSTGPCTQLVANGDAEVSIAFQHFDNIIDYNIYQISRNKYVCNIIKFLAKYFGRMADAGNPRRVSCDARRGTSECNPLLHAQRPFALQ